MARKQGCWCLKIALNLVASNAKERLQMAAKIRNLGLKLSNIKR
jgi:hypothetical protein